MPVPRSRPPAGRLARIIQTGVRRPWTAFAIHPDHVKQARAELLAAGATLVVIDEPASKSWTTGFMLPDGHCCLLGSVATLPRHALLTVADAGTLQELCAAVQDGLDRLAAGLDRLGQDHRPLIVPPRRSLS